MGCLGGLTYNTIPKYRNILKIKHKLVNCKESAVSGYSYSSLVFFQFFLFSFHGYHCIVFVLFFGIHIMVVFSSNLMLGDTIPQTGDLLVKANHAASHSAKGCLVDEMRSSKFLDHSLKTGGSTQVVSAGWSWYGPSVALPINQPVVSPNFSFGGCNPRLFSTVLLTRNLSPGRDIWS